MAGIRFILISLGLLALVPRAQKYNDKCLKTYDEINLISKNGEAVQQPGIFASDYDLLMAIQDSHRVFYHVDKIVACLSGDR